MSSSIGYRSGIWSGIWSGSIRWRSGFKGRNESSTIGGTRSSLAGHGALCGSRAHQLKGLDFDGARQDL